MARKRMGNVAAASLAASGSINFTDGSFFMREETCDDGSRGNRKSRNLYITAVFNPVGISQRCLVLGKLE